MKKTTKYILCTIATACLLACDICAASPKSDGKPTTFERMKRDYKKFDDFVKKFLLDGVDTNYIDIPKTSWEIPVTAMVYGENMSIAPYGKKLQLENGHYFEAGAGIGYHGLDAVYTVTVGPSMGFNFRFDFYDNYFGVAIEISENDYGKEIYGEPISNSIENSPEVSVKSVLLDGYFAFNGGKFSLASVLYGNYIQKKSAGSPIVAGWYNNINWIPHTPQANALLKQLTRNQLHTGAIVGGYGYNFAFLQGKVVLSIMGGVGVTIPHCGVAAIAKLSAIYWINDHFRINAYLNNFYQQSPSEKDLRYSDNIWRSSLSVAYCF